MKIKLSLAFLFIASLAFAQDEKGHFGISLGPAFPMGDFSSRDATSENAGLAKRGAIFDLAFAHKIGESDFGISARVIGQSFAIDADAIADIFALQYPMLNFTAEGESWTSGGLYIGGYTSLGLSSTTTFDIKAMIGFSSSGSPEYTLTATGTGINGSVTIQQQHATTTAFAYLLGAGLKFSVGKGIYILTNIDYIGSKPEFTNVKVIASDGSYDITSFRQEMTSINTSIGIGFKL